MTKGNIAASIGSMQRFLLAWRRHKQFTQEEVAGKLGVAHTTIGRWEKSEMAIDTASLTSLARIYGCTPAQLVGGPPEAAAEIAALTELRDLMENLPEDARREWLSIGYRLAGRPKT